jgi:hypothetical protein
MTISFERLPATISTRVVVAVALVLLPGAWARAQDGVRIIALKSGEVSEVQDVWSVANCRSVLTAPPQVEVLEAPPQLTLTVKPAMVIPRRFNCAQPVQGGKIIATVGEVKEPIRGRLVYRTLYKTKDGDRHVGQVYEVALYPAPKEK